MLTTIHELQLGTRNETVTKCVWLYAGHADINDATSFYIDTIAKALKGLGRRLVHVDNLGNIPSQADVFVVDCKHALALHLCRPRCRFWLWLQGIVPEEAELQRGSQLRKMYWTMFERRSIPRANGVFMVSEAMKLHYANKYNFANITVLTMPCVNQKLNHCSFATPLKYSSLRFVYAGGLQLWQCFDKTLDSYSLIKKSFPSATFTVLTRDRLKALDMIERRMVQGVSVDYCRPSEMQNVLAKFKYGFVLRHPHPVNAVATPTKVSSYMAAGVIPIMTTAVSDYAKRLAGIEPVVMLEKPEPQLVLKGVSRVESISLDQSAVFDSYSRAFEQYFDLERYVPLIQAFFLDTGMTVS